MAPIFAKLISIIPGILNTAGSIIRDKKIKQVTKDAAGNPEIVTDGTEFVHETIDKGISLSSKRILNIAGTGIIVTIALNDIAKNGITKFNLILLAIGAAYSVGMAFITYWSEKK